jgi:hypothetical protein
MSEQIQRYNNGSYYSYEGVVYVGTFPEEWATNHMPDTGPHECGNCFHLGTIRNVFIGYCAECADRGYNGSRGRGFVDVATEDFRTVTDNDALYQSAFDTYLRDINLNDINIEDAHSPNEAVYDEAYHARVIYEFLTNFEEPPEENKETDFDYEDDALDMTTLNMCHFEGGYNDW